VPPANAAPPDNGEPSSVPRALTSWKEIADYLGVAVRTAQKWELERNLPVLHLPGPKGRVSADPTEVERWRQITVQRPAWHRRVGFLRAYALVVTILLVIAIGAEVIRYVIVDRPGLPASFRISSNALTIVDEQGRDVWTKTFPESLLAVRYSDAALAVFKRAWVGDLDRDGSRETLFSYHPAAGRGAPAFVVFSNDGEEQWRFLPGDRVKGGQPLSPLVEIQDFDVADLDGDGNSEVVLAVNHPMRREVQVAVLDRAGKLRAEYWTAGRSDHVAVGDLNADGESEIYSAGVSPRDGGAVLGVLDARRLLSGPTPQRTIAPASNMTEPEVARARVVFPRTCINRAVDVTNRANRLEINASSIQITVGERQGDPSVWVRYTLDGSLQVMDVQVSEQFRSVHRQLESAGQLDHALSEEEISGLRAVRVVTRAVTPLARR
jgi:hypothetical protein